MLSKEHKKLVERFQDYKKRTQGKVDLLEEMREKTKEFTIQQAIEAPVKEALYALDSKNPLSRFQQIVPELDAHRGLKLPIKPDLREANNLAKLELENKKYKEAVSEAERLREENQELS